MRQVYVIIILLFNIQIMFAQWPAGGRGGQKMNMNMGHFYGKVIDSASGKGIEFAVIQLFGNKLDTATKAMKRGLIEGQLTKANGDFSLENLPVMGEFTLKISAMGFQPVERAVSFNLNMGKIMEKNMSSGNMNSMSSAMNAIDKDLGNIRMKMDVKQLSAVTITEETPEFEMKLDKKVFNVDKNITATGGTAEDVLKVVPSLNVDIDGNVTLRNAAPQIFVDGKPTTLSLDQIPSDAIQSVEVITNPSAKYEASGGQAGIVNIVLKKARKNGYNGTVRAGVDSRGKCNGGADLSSRQGKVNVFSSVFLNQRKSHNTGTTDRHNLLVIPETKIFQETESNSNGVFGFGRLGFDFFIDNRNTITASGSYAKGAFKSKDELINRTDTIPETGNNFSSYDRNSNSDREFSNMGGSLQYKHLFPKAGEELTGDVYYNKMANSNNGKYETQYLSGGIIPIGPVQFQKQNGNGKNEFITVQTDYVNPLKEKLKIETGFRASLKNIENSSDNYLYNYLTKEYMAMKNLNSKYSITDQVYAGYASFSNQIKKISYQVGLRVESSFYHGELPDSNRIFENSYPLSFFPSAFFTYQLSEKSDLQFSYSRRINRPSFFNTIPFTDYSDSLSLSRGNPDLKPEFTNSFELSYLKTFNRTNNILLSAYFKNSTDLITRYQVSEYDVFFGKNMLINTYKNANSSMAYGVEFTFKNSPKKWFEVMLNINAYNSVIDAGNIQASLTNEQFSWFAKSTITFKLPKEINLQFTGDYRSKASLQNTGGGNSGSGGGGNRGGMGGGMMWGGGSSSTAQGYVKPNYGLDIGVKKDFLKNKMLSLSVNMSDVFKTRKNETYIESTYFTQTTYRLRDPQIIRLNVSYRFGKFDTSLFKRKNNNINMEGMQDGGSGG